MTSRIGPLPLTGRDDTSAHAPVVGARPVPPAGVTQGAVHQTLHTFPFGAVRPVTMQLRVGFSTLRHDQP